MSREFGIYPTNREPQLWIGCRAIVDYSRNIDIPWDRWSNDIRYQGGKENFVMWINNVALKEAQGKIKHFEHKFYFESENGLYYCEGDENGRGYLYIGFGSTEKYDEMIKER